MITLQVIGTDISYILPNNRTDEWVVMQELLRLPPDTLLLIVETGEEVTRDVIIDKP